MDDPGPANVMSAAIEVLPKILLLFILILVNAFFAMSEIAIISLNDNKMQKLAEEGNKKAKQIVKLTENSSRSIPPARICLPT